MKSLSLTESGIKLDEGHVGENYLAAAVANPDINVFNMLLQAGASTVRAIPGICVRPDTEDRAFKDYFPRIIDQLKPTADQVRYQDAPDPLTAVLQSNRALEVRPNAPQALLQNSIFLASRLHRSKQTFPCHSYVFWAISYDRVGALKELLKYDPPLYSTIDDMFDTSREHFQPIKDFTWLTLAVQLGRPQCVRLIVDHAASQENAVAYRDGADRTALEIAQSCMMMHHPRPSVLQGLHWTDQQDSTLINASADKETYLILQSASDVRNTSNNPSTNTQKVAMGTEKSDPIMSFVISALLHLATLVAAQIAPPSSRKVLYKTSKSCSQRQEQGRDLNRLRWPEVYVASCEAIIVMLLSTLMVFIVVIYDLTCLFLLSWATIETSRLSWIALGASLLYFLWIS